MKTKVLLKEIHEIIQDNPGIDFRTAYLAALIVIYKGTYGLTERAIREALSCVLEL